MSEELLALIALVALATMYKLDQDNRKERQAMLDRIQSGSLAEYKVYSEPKPEPEQKEQKEPINFL